MPNYAQIMTGTTSLQARRKQESLLDHEHFVLTLEAGLTAAFMYAGDPNLQLKCVPTNRTAISLGESIEDGRAKQKKFTSYVIYVAYRLDPPQAYNHQAKMSRQISVTGHQPSLVLSNSASTAAGLGIDIGNEHGNGLQNVIAEEEEADDTMYAF